jgi:phosphatidylglycerol:prolipoprotein diacylglycerol transferase
MHPILFKIPLPKYALPWTWVLLAIAGLSLAFAIAYLARKNREGAGIAGVIAVAAGGVGLYLRGQVWDMTPVPIYSYGVMLGLSLVVGWYLTLGLAERDGLPKETMANCYVVTAVAAVIGSRVLYILTNLNEFDSIASLFAMRRGGLVAYGGFLGGLAGSFFFLRRAKISLLPWADVAVPSLCSGLMITRLGCYMFGCDFGQPLKAGAPMFLQKLGTFPHWAEGTLDHGSGSPAWAQHLHEGKITADALTSLPVHPTQLYESLVGLGLLALLLYVRSKQKFRGEIFFLFAFAYGVCRYLLEVLRDDAERGSIPPSLPEHILVPLGYAVLAAGFAIGFSQLIKNITMRRVAQVAAFLPAILLFVALKPEAFETNMQFSTSQFIGITSGFAACVAFAVFYKAALAHPESAMALRLPLPAGAPVPATDDEDDEDEDDEDDETEEEKAAAAAAAAKKKAAAKKTAAKKKAAKPAPKPVVDDADEDAGDAPSSKKEAAPTSVRPAPEKAEEKAEKKDDADAEDEES